MSTDINYNVAQSTNFKAEIAGADHFNFFIQQVSIPSISIPEVPTPYSNNFVYMPGDTVEYDPITFVFIVNEDYANYIYILDWMKDQQKREAPKDRFKDITIHVLNNNKLANLRFVLYNSFPTSLGNIDLESAVVEAATPVCQVTFRYQYFDVFFES
jgi:hypothetical protein